MSKLNKIDDDAASELEKYYQKWIEEKVRGSEEYEAHLTLGLLAWRSANTKLMEDHLARAASVAVNIYTQRAPQGKREPDRFVMPLMLTLLFGDTAMKQRVAEIPRQHWFTPETLEFKPLADLIDLLRHGLPEGDANEHIKKITDQNNCPGVNLFYRPWIKAMCSGLLAVSSQEIKSLQSALDELVELHADEAWEGDWQYRVDGLIATWASVLYKLSLEAGLKPDFSSEYVPARVLF